MLSLPWWVEALAALFGLIATYLYARGWYITFIIGLLNTLPFVYIFLQRGIYAQGIIHVYYSVMNILGLMLWYKDDKNAALKYRYLSLRQFFLYVLYLLGICLILWLLYLSLPAAQLPDSKVILWDTLSTAMAIIAMFLGVNKYIDSWYYWLAYDVISMVLSLQSQLYFAALQFGLYLVVGCYGWKNWHKLYREQA